MRFKSLKEKAVFMIVVIVMSIFYVYIYNAKDVEAQNNNVCCERIKSGDFCVYTDASNCDPNYKQATTTCENTAFCKPICCVDKIDGVCSNNVAAANCLNNNGLIYNQNCTAVDACQKGCCQIGTQCYMTTEQKCKSDANYYPALDTSNIFDSSISSEGDCISKCQAVDEGCCVDPNNGCSYTTMGQCSVADQTKYDGSIGFFKNTYCSSSTLNCAQCKAKAKKGCIPESEDVYWFDSCGNKEGLAEDCDYSGGTLCFEGNGTANCRSVNCEDTQEFFDEQGRNMNPQDPKIGGFRYNGESWCVYESATGDFLDRPGSRHYKSRCANGEEIIEPCRDFREEICIQEDSDVNGTIKSVAQCRDIDEFPKLDIDKLKNKFQQPPDFTVCDGVLGCYINWTAYNDWRNGLSTSIDPDDLVMPGTPEFNDPGKTLISTSTVDKGAEFWDGENRGECNKGTVSCTVVWLKKHHLDDWDCEANCDCEKPQFIEDAANYCKMFGDCGADINIAGQGTQAGLKVEWDGTSKGPHPRIMPSSAYSKWDKYGVVGGMKTIDTAMEDYKVLTGSVKIVVFIIGIILAIFVSILLGLFLILGAIFGWGIITKIVGAKDKHKTITVHCKPWTAPLGGDNCEKCDDPRFECSEYKCRSLGAACKYLAENEGTDREKCVEDNPNDVVPPDIKPWYEALSAGYNIQMTSTGYAITPDIKVFTPLSFGIELNELGMCKYDIKHTTNVDEMENEFGEPFWENKKNMTFMLPPGESYSFFLRCQDIHGNGKDSKEYEITMRVEKLPDKTPPEIFYTSINNGAYIKYGINETALNLFVNEPANCKWSKSDDDYDVMGNEFACNNETQTGPVAYDNFECITQLKELKDSQNNQFFFRCKDNNGNAMQEGYEFNLVGTVPLMVESAGPSGEIYTNSPEITAVTKNGAESGKATCEYSINSKPYVEFVNTNSNAHSQPLINLSMGTYDVNVKCEDTAGNEGEGSTNFIVSVDTEAPKITYVYLAGNTLTIMVNENSNCKYSINDKDFEYGSGTSMSGDGTKQHSLNKYSNVYYIKCSDVFNNIGSYTIYR